MSAVERELEAIIRREADGVRPPEGAKERGWARLAAALPTDGGGPDDEGGPDDGGGPDGGSAPPAGPVPPLKAVPLLKVVPLVVLLVVGGALVPWGMGGGPPVVADSLPGAPEPAPAFLFGAPVHIPFAPEPSAAPPSAAREASTGESGVSAPARTTPRPRADDGEDNFAGELSLLAAGQAAIQRGELREGIALLRTHKQRFPRGQFAQERDALIAIARCEGGQAGAREAGRKFLQANAESIHAERVRAACKIEENEE